jgi:replicative DNA helicase
MDDLDPLLTEPPGPDDSAEAHAEAAKRQEARKAFDTRAPLLGSFLGDAVAAMERRATGAEKPLPIPHLPSVAEALCGGLWPGMHVLVGNTGSGKSQFALQLSYEAAKQGAPVLYIGLELGRTDLAARMLGLASGKRWSRLYLGEDLGELREIAATHGPELERLPWRLEVAPPYGWSYRELEPRVRALVEHYGESQYPPLVVLDFAQLVASPKDEPTEAVRERIQKAAYAGRAVARECGAAVLMVSSTARANYGKLWGAVDTGSNGKPQSGAKPAWGAPAYLVVGMGKESGEVEYSADSVLVLASEPRKDGAPFTRVHLAVAKQRFGPSTWVHGLRFDGGRFKESTSESVTLSRKG